ncbi:MAG: head-tail connector protein [Pseudomonadota bacterium]
MSLTLITPPAAEPVLLADLKEHLKIDGDAEDALIAGLGLAARQTIEARFGLAIMAQSWRLALDTAPDCALTLPLSPVLSIDSVGVVRGGVTEALGASSYETQTGLIGRIRIKTPAASDRAFGGVVIAFTAGWTDAGAVPEELKLAIRLLAAHYYEHREGEAAAPAVSALVAPYRRALL